MSEPQTRITPLSLPKRIFRQVVHGFAMHGYSLRTRVATAVVVVAALVVITGAVIGGSVGVAVSAAVRNAWAAEPIVDGQPLPPR